MADKQTIFNWRGALDDTYQDVLKQLVENAPQFVGALLLLFGGWLVARLLRLLARKMVLAFDTILPKNLKKQEGKGSPLTAYAHWGGNIVFWAVLLFFIAASANILQWKLFSGLSAALLAYLPNLLTGLLIIVAGFALGGVARSATLGAVHSAGLQQESLIASTVQVVVVLSAVVIGVEQLGVNVAFLTTTLIVVVGIVLGGASLAFGLGSREFVANVIGVNTVRKHYQIGQQLKIADIQGEILEITQTNVVLDTEKGRATVPAKLFQEHICELETDTSSGGSLFGNFFHRKEGLESTQAQKPEEHTERDLDDKAKQGKGE